MNPYAPPKDTLPATRRHHGYRLDSWYHLILMVLFMMAPGLVLAAVAASL